MTGCCSSLQYAVLPLHHQTGWLPTLQASVPMAYARYPSTGPLVV